MTPSHTQKRITALLHRVGGLGGMEQTYLKILKQLVEQGWQVDLYAFDLSDWDKRLPITWHRVSGVWLRPQLIKDLWFFLLSWYWVVSGRISRNSLTFTSGAAAYWARVRVVQYVHQEAFNQMRQKRFSYPNVKTPIHFIYQWISMRWNMFCEKKYLPQCEKIVGVSSSVSQSVTKIYGSRLKSTVETIAHGFEFTETITPRLNNPPKILFVGALERKGIAMALEILGYLQALDWEFTVLGNGDIRKWEKMAARLGISDRVRFLGQTNAVPYFGKADIFLFPSHYEPYGLVVAEAIEHGCLPLASIECGAMGSWEDRPDWLSLSVQSDVQLWVTALSRILKDVTLREQILNDAVVSMKRWQWSDVGLAYSRLLQTIELSQQDPGENSRSRAS